MNMTDAFRKLVLTAAIFALFTLVFAPAVGLAAPHGKGGKGKVALSSHEADKTAKKIARLKKQARHQIDVKLRRIAKLQAKVVRIDRLTQLDRDTLVADLQSEAASLESLKAEVEAANDLATLRAQLRSIKKDHKLGIFDIRIARLRAAFNVGTELQRIDEEGVTAEARIAEAQATGHDVTALLALSADFDAQFAAAQASLAQAIAGFTGMKPSIGLKASISLQKQSNTALAAARAALAAAQADLDQINAGLAALPPVPPAPVTPDPPAQPGEPMP